MFDESPYDTGCSFRTQSQFPSAAVFKDVHFFLDHVRGFTEGTLKQVNRFKSRGSDFLKSEAFKEVPSRLFQDLKMSGIKWKNVLGAANSLIFRHGAELYNLR